MNITRTVETVEGRLDFTGMIHDPEVRDNFLSFIKKARKKGIEYLPIEFHSSGLMVKMTVHTDESKWTHPLYPKCEIYIREETTV